MTERLTTLANVKEWLSITSTPSDAELTRVIDAVSQFILNYINRASFQRKLYTQNFKGYGKCSTLIRNWPVLSISAVDTGGVSIPASTFTNGMPSSGYYLGDERGGPQALDLQGYIFREGVPSLIAYESGFETSQSSEIPDTPFQITPTNDGCWSNDLGVTIDGVDAIKVSSSPSTGEYFVDDWGTYTFSDADKTKTAVMSYSFTPSAVSFSATETVAEWFKRKDRIGLLSKTLGGQETMVFSTADMSQSSKATLQAYRNVIPA